MKGITNYRTHHCKNTFTLFQLALVGGLLLSGCNSASKPSESPTEFNFEFDSDNQSPIVPEPSQEESAHAQESNLVNDEGEALADISNDYESDIEVYETRQLLIEIPGQTAVQESLFLKVYDDPFSPVFLGEVVPSSENGSFVVNITVSVKKTLHSLSYDFFSMNADFEDISGVIEL